MMRAASVLALSVLALVLPTKADDDCWQLCFTSKPAKVSSTMTFNQLDTATYNSDYTLKRTYEVGYGIGLGIFDTTTGKFKQDSYVKSTASRRAAAITFTATVHTDLGAAATTANTQLTAANMVDHVTAAKAIVPNAASVTVPTASDITMPAAPPATPTPAPTLAPTLAPTASSSDDSDTTLIIIIIVVVVVLVVGAGGGMYYYQQQEQLRKEKEEADRKAAEAEAQRVKDEEMIKAKMALEKEKEEAQAKEDLEAGPGLPMINIACC